MEAESVGVKRAEVSSLKMRFEKEIKTKNSPRNFNSRLNHPPVRFCIFFLALHIDLFYHKQNDKFMVFE